VAEHISHTIKGTSETGFAMVGKWKTVSGSGGVNRRVFPSASFLRRTEPGCLHGFFGAIGVGEYVKGFARRVVQKCSQFPFPEIVTGMLRVFAGVGIAYGSKE